MRERRVGYRAIQRSDGDIVRFVYQALDVRTEVPVQCDTSPRTSSYSARGRAYGVVTTSSGMQGGHCAAIDPHRSTV